MFECWYEIKGDNMNEILENHSKDIRTDVLIVDKSYGKKGLILLNIFEKIHMIKQMRKWNKEYETNYRLVRVY